MRYKLKRTEFILLLLLSSLTLLAQEKKQTLVYLEHSNTLSFDSDRLPDAQLLKGDVRFRHEDMLMFCDSAYFYEKTNSLDAFGNVRFNQADTLEGFGDMLYYDGNQKVAHLKNNVRLLHNKQTELTTDSLTYDRQQDIAWYSTGGTIRDSVNTLTSVWGQYTPYNSQALFKDSVHLLNENFILDSDTLKYNTDNHIANILGPTTIVYDGETTIFSTKGWYNTETEKSMLLNRSTITHTDGQTLTADTIYYDKKLGFGQLLQSLQITDSTRKTTLYGNYGEAYEEEKHGFATDSALLIDWSEEKWTYAHADTIFTAEIPYKAMLSDSTEVDTSYIQVKAYYNVRVYREDVQSVCDSLYYNGKDSVMTLCGTPICWNEDQQISADTIRIFMKNETVDYIHGIGAALAVKQEEGEKFDQLSGKEMKAYIIEEEIRQLDVNGNAETVFYPREEDGSILGVNKTQSSYVSIFFKDEAIDHILFTTATTGTMYPLKDMSDNEAKLANFFWADFLRPLVPGDVFLHPDRKADRPTQTTLSAVDNSPKESKEEDKNKNKKHKRR